MRPYFMGWWPWCHQGSHVAADRAPRQRIERWTGRTQPSQPVLAAAAAYRRMLVGASNNYTGFDPAAAARNSALPWLPWRPEVHQGLPPVDLQNAGDSVITPPFPCSCMESLLMTADLSQE
jgi:hypothetical protein